MVPVGWIDSANYEHQKPELGNQGSMQTHFVEILIVNPGAGVRAAEVHSNN